MSISFSSMTSFGPGARQHSPSRSVMGDGGVMGLAAVSGGSSPFKKTFAVSSLKSLNRRQHYVLVLDFEKALVSFHKVRRGKEVKRSFPFQACVKLERDYKNTCQLTATFGHEPRYKKLLFFVHNEERELFCNLVHAMIVSGSRAVKLFKSLQATAAASSTAASSTATPSASTASAAGNVPFDPTNGYEDAVQSMDFCDFLISFSSAQTQVSLTRSQPVVSTGTGTYTISGASANGGRAGLTISEEAALGPGRARANANDPQAAILAFLQENNDGTGSGINGLATSNLVSLLNGRMLDGEKPVNSSDITYRVECSCGGITQTIMYRQADSTAAGATAPHQHNLAGISPALIAGTAAQQKKDAAAVETSSKEGTGISASSRGLFLLTNYRILYINYNENNSFAVHEAATNYAAYALGAPASAIAAADPSSSLTSTSHSPSSACTCDADIPLGLIARVMKSSSKTGADGCEIRLHLKDGRRLEFGFDAAPKWVEGLLMNIQKLAFPKDQTKLFAFEYKYNEGTVDGGRPMASLGRPLLGLDPFGPDAASSLDGWDIYDALQDYTRITLASDPSYRVCGLNVDFKLCGSYPPWIVTPTTMRDDEIKSIAAYRSQSRLPAVVWIHPLTRATLSRCAQPLVGLKGKRSEVDEKLVYTLRTVNPSNSSVLHIIDARPWKAALGNMTMGKGTENINHYEKATLSYMNIDNIHAARAACLTPDHQAFVKNRGWVDLPDVRVGEQVWSLAAFGEDTRAGWQQVTHLVCVKLEPAEEMHCIETDTLNLITTSDHVNWVRSESDDDAVPGVWLKEASAKLSAPRRFLQGAPDCARPAHTWSDDLAFLSQDINTNASRQQAWCAFLGFVLAQSELHQDALGTITLHTGGSASVHQWLLATIEQLEWHCSINGENTISIEHNDLAAYLAPMLASGSLHYSWQYELSLVQARFVLYGHAIGSSLLLPSASTPLFASATSHALRNNLCALAALAGWPTSSTSTEAPVAFRIDYRACFDPMEPAAGEPTYTVVVPAKHRTTRVIPNTTHAYCLTVRTGNFLTRRCVNAADEAMHLVYTGNCDKLQEVISFNDYAPLNGATNASSGGASGLFSSVSSQSSKSGEAVQTGTAPSAFLSSTTSASLAYDESFLSKLEATLWLHYVRLILSAAQRIAVAMSEEGASCITHCSDGWDRTSQLAALTELMLDPFYRTFEGFACLIEKEWLSFGHQFAERHGHASDDYQHDQRAPIFLQFLDCVYQLLHQFPDSFEFTEEYLIAIFDAVFSHRFGTFLYNNYAERVKHDLRNKTVSLWTFLLHEKIRVKYVNERYVHPKHVARWSARDVPAARQRTKEATERARKINEATASGSSAARSLPPPISTAGLSSIVPPAQVDPAQASVIASFFCIPSVSAKRLVLWEKMHLRHEREHMRTQRHIQALIAARVTQANASKLYDSPAPPLLAMQHSSSPSASPSPSPSPQPTVTNDAVESAWMQRYNALMSRLIDAGIDVDKLEADMSPPPTTAAAPASAVVNNDNIHRDVATAPTATTANAISPAASPRNSSGSIGRRPSHPTTSQLVTLKASIDHDALVAAKSKLHAAPTLAPQQPSTVSPPISPASASSTSSAGGGSVPSMPRRAPPPSPFASKNTTMTPAMVAAVHAANASRAAVAPNEDQAKPSSLTTSPTNAPIRFVVSAPTQPSRASISYIDADEEDDAPPPPAAR